MISFAHSKDDANEGRRAQDSSSDLNGVTQSPPLPDLIVGLVVATGSHRGVTAEIKEGIYMIGRDQECQIRPKSHSVSERHCLVQHQYDVVRVFDLDSEEGTFVNDQRVAPKTWMLLNHGDQLRCGRYVFEVAIHVKPARESVTKAVESKFIRPVAPEAQRSDLPSVAQSAIDEAMDETTFEDDFEFENLDESQSHSRPSSQLPEPAAAVSPGVSKEAKSRAPLPKPKISYRSSSRFSGFSWELGGADAWKLWVACIAMIATLGYAGWSVYQIKNGAPIKILRGID